MQDVFDEINKLQEKINSLRPLDKKQLNHIKQYYNIGLAYSSNALEGNSLTESETKIVIEDGLTVDGKPLRDHFEAVGHAQAYEYLYSRIKDKGFDEALIKKMHHFFYFRIDEKYAGVYRDIKVAISGSAYELPLPIDVPKLMDQFIKKYGTDSFDMHPVKLAALVHKEFVFIHPFIDGNGRVARLLMNLVLLQAGYPIAIIPPIRRREYINALEKAHIDDADFINFIAQCMKETQKDYLRLFA